ncbi:MAG TPA: S53 family peptidase [Kofleriaceae bacterium]
MGALASCALESPQEDAPDATGACSGGRFRCFAQVREGTRVAGEHQYANPTGFGPADLQDAYAIPAATGTPTIALIDAYGYTQLEHDLGVYRAQYGLPACTVANGCLTIVNDQGQPTPLPGAAPAGDDWTIETALDVDMASAACPACKLVVVQATDDQGDGLFTAQNVAAGMGATVISNSWGGPEQPGMPLGTYEAYMAHAGIAVFVAAGDDGYDDAGMGPDYPATSTHVIAVGGTKLVKSATARGWAETAWSSGGSACSLSIPKPAYQTASPCTYKATTDVAAVGDPATGLAVYDSHSGGWQVVGGTSAAAPIVAAIFAATGNGAQTSGSFLAANAAKLNDVTAGSNGSCGTLLCNAATGWDGPTGYGTLNGEAIVAQQTGGDGSGSGSGDDGGGTEGAQGATAPGGEVTGGCNVGGNAGGGTGGAASSVVGLALGFAAITRRRRLA